MTSGSGLTTYYQSISLKESHNRTAQLKMAHKNNTYPIWQTPQQYYTCAQWEVYQIDILNALLFQQ